MYIHQATLSNANINDWTKFDDICIYELKNIGPGDSRSDKAVAITWVYRSLSILYKNNALSERARGFYIKKEESKRRGYWRMGCDKKDLQKFGQYIISSLNYVTSKHGESPPRVISISLILVILFGSIYPLIGGVRMDTSEAEILAYHLPSMISIRIPYWLEILIANFYFSAVTFTTLGYGDIQPATATVRVLASIESFLGALLIALFVYTLGRRTTW